MHAEPGENSDRKAPARIAPALLAALSGTFRVKLFGAIALGGGALESIRAVNPKEVYKELLKLERAGRVTRSSDGYGLDPRSFERALSEVRQLIVSTRGPAGA